MDQHGVYHTVYVPFSLFFSLEILPLDFHFMFLSFVNKPDFKCFRSTGLALLTSSKFIYNERGVLFFLDYLFFYGMIIQKTFILLIELESRLK